MTDSFWEELNSELHKGVSKKGHPFRYCTLATIGVDSFSRQRTVVLRNVTDDLKLTFYTDKRSKKIIHIREDNRVSVLFYHPKILLQIKVEGLASVITDKAILQKYWSGVQPNNRKDYTTNSAPGSSIFNPDTIEYLDKENHFSIVEIEPFKIEYLKLKRPNHLRIQFSKIDAEWDGEFLVP